MWSESQQRFSWVIQIAGTPECVYVMGATSEQAIHVALSFPRKPGVDTFIAMETVELIPQSE